MIFSKNSSCSEEGSAAAALAVASARASAAHRCAVIALRCVSINRGQMQEVYPRWMNLGKLRDLLKTHEDVRQNSSVKVGTTARSVPANRDAASLRERSQPSRRDGRE